MENEEQQLQESNVNREEPQPEEGVRQNVAAWQSKIRASKTFFSNDFKRMRENMQLARQGASKEWVEAGNYTVPIINRFLNQAVASLYAKNPTATASRRKRIDYTVWDGRPETANAALQGLQRGDVSALPLISDIMQVQERNKLIDRMGKTLEYLYDYFANEQKPRLKPKMKKLIRRVKTCGVGYVMLGFQREYAQLSPDDTATLFDSREKLGELQRRMQDFVDGELDCGREHEVHQLETLIADLEAKENVILREGPVFMFPRSTEIIVDPHCKDLSHFEGAGWVAREFQKSPEDIQKIYNVDVKRGFTPYTHNGADRLSEYDNEIQSDDKPADGHKDQKGMVCVWEVYNKTLGQTFTIADGYPDYLVAPKEPDYFIEGFWPIFSLMFNEVEDEENLYPLSDVDHLVHTQLEYNRSREYRRLHREANKPKYFTSKGRLDEEDKSKLKSHQPHEIIEVNGMTTGENVNQLIQRFDAAPIDPALYETNSEMEDVLRIVGAQEANLGGASGGTATESSIAEGSRMSSLSSNVDDIDEFLTDLVGAMSQMMIMELSKETVIEVVGAGAAWPELDREAVAKELSLKLVAGSSGRPNKAAELANMERGMPYFMQLPGYDPNILGPRLGDRYADLLEIDITDAQLNGMPSITALNSAMGSANPMGAGTPNDPSMQGNAGAQNAEQPMQNEPGGQPSYQAQQMHMQFDDNGSQI